MNKTGLTLIEVLVSIIVFAVGMAGGMAFFFHLSEIASQARHEKMAVQLANSGMEQLRGMSYASLTVGTWNLNSVSIDSGASSTPVVVIADQGIYKVAQVSLGWWEPSLGQNQTVSLVSYIGSTSP